ncbi:MAG: hypothetical protein ACK41P_10775 [Asticcacaulis sp.]
MTRITKALGRSVRFGQLWRSVLNISLVSLVFALAACDAGPTAVVPDPKERAVAEVGPEQTIDWAQNPSEIRDTGGNEDARGRREDSPALAQGERNPDTPLYKGRPLWSSNRKYTALENAQYHFESKGEMLGTPTYEAFLAKVHGFIRNPPEGTLTLKRNNGDTLYYHPPTNQFAVATRAGAPRTMFKPDDGMAYWQKQKQREAGRRTVREET